MIEPKTLSHIEQDPGTAKTQLVMVTGMLVLAWLFDSIYFVYIGGIAGIVSFIPPLGNRLVWGWYKLSEGLGWFNSRVLLSVVYYVIVTPIGVLFRLFGNDPLQLKKQKGSMYEFREHKYSKEDLENPW